MNTPKRYTKKPVTIEAMLFTGVGNDIESMEDDVRYANVRAINAWMGTESRLGFERKQVMMPIQEGSTDMMLVDKFEAFLKIETLEGVMQANVGDYIIKGVKGEFYPCKPDIFELSYVEG